MAASKIPPCPICGVEVVSFRRGFSLGGAEYKLFPCGDAVFAWEDARSKMWADALEAYVRGRK